MLNKTFSDNMRKNRFEIILQYLHVADSINLPKDIKVGRVSEYHNQFRNNFKAHCIWNREFDINECMVEYFGLHETFLKQSIIMKLIRIGYNIWCANLPLGYPSQFTIYEGSTSRKTDKIATLDLVLELCRHRWWFASWFEWQSEVNAPFSW